MELKNISQTKIVSALPQSSDLIANCFYLVKNNTDFDLHYTDLNKNVRKLFSLSDSPKDGSDYARKNGVWSKISNLSFQELTNQNLNDIKTFGFYGKYNSAEVTTALNYPNNGARGGHLMVLPMTENAGTLTVFQVYWSAGTQNAGEYTNTPRLYMRAFVNNSNWLEWKEFDCGKIHQFTNAVQNLANLHNDSFSVGNSIFVLKQGTTITVPNKTLKVTYIKDTENDIIFAPSGVTLIGDATVKAPKGTQIDLVVQDGFGYINYSNKQQSSNVQLDNNIGLWN